MQGAVRYYGTEESVTEMVRGKLVAGGLDPRLGVADGPFAATWAARVTDDVLVVGDTREFLASLDVSCLGHDDIAAVFRWLGVTTLGSLADLPRQAVASRFGVEGLAMHRLAHGEDRSVEPRTIPPELAVEAEYEDPLEEMDRLAFASRALSARLMSGLRREGLAPYRVAVEIESTNGVVRERVWRSASPFDESTLTDRVWWQARAWVDSGTMAGGVVRLRLDPSDVTGRGRQADLFEDASSRIDAERALARAEALLGPDSVLQAEMQGGRQPDERVRWRRWGDPASPPEAGEPWPGATPPPVPALVPPNPSHIQIEWDGGAPVRVRLGSRWEPVLTWAGPWRLTGRWWRGETPVDRYQIVTSAGAFLCVVDGDGACVSGVYD
jgi:protein ImuB